jgi:hypothetical protein
MSLTYSPAPKGGDVTAPAANAERIINRGNHGNHVLLRLKFLKNGSLSLKLNIAIILIFIFFYNISNYYDNV